MRLVSGVLWNWGERVWVCLLQAGWTPPQLYCAWLEGSQQLHNALRQRKHQLGPQRPAASLLLIQVLGKTSSSFAEDKCSVKQGVIPLRRGMGWWLETGVSKKHHHMMAVRDKHACDLWIAFRRKLYFFPHFPCPVVFACVSHYFYLKIILIQWIIDVGSLVFLQELLSLTSDPSWIF